MKSRKNRNRTFMFNLLFNLFTNCLKILKLILKNLFVQNLLYANSYINQKGNIIKKLYYCYFLLFSLCSLQSNRVDAIQSYQVVSQEFSEKFPERNVSNKTNNLEKCQKISWRRYRFLRKLILDRGLIN